MNFGSEESEKWLSKAVEAYDSSFHTALRYSPREFRDGDFVSECDKQVGVGMYKNSQFYKNLNAEKQNVTEKKM